MADKTGKQTSGSGLCRKRVWAGVFAGMFAGFGFMLSSLDQRAWGQTTDGQRPAAVSASASPEAVEPPPVEPLSVEIVAHVNDYAITNIEVQKITQGLLFQAGLPLTSQNTEAFAREARDIAIELAVKKNAVEQTAAIEVTDADIDTQVARLEQRNQLPPGGLKQAFEAYGADFDNFREKIRIEIGWNTLIQSRFGTRVHITENEIETAIQQRQKNAAEEQWLLSEILLGYHTPSEAEAAYERALKLIREIDSAEKFRNFATIFSQGGTAESQQGLVGWLHKDLLSHPYREALVAHRRAGLIATPVRGPNFYAILYVENYQPAQAPRVTLIQSLFLRAPAEIPARPREFAPLECQSAPDFQETQTQIRELYGPDRLNLLKEVALDKLNNDIRDKIIQAQPGTTLGPFPQTDGESFLTLCAVQQPESLAPRREHLTQQLRSARLGNFSRQYLAELRQKALIERLEPPPSLSDSQTDL